MIRKSDSRASSEGISLRRILFAVLIAVALAGVLFSQRDAFQEHRLYFTQERQGVLFRLEELSETWTEQSLGQRFPGIPIRCSYNPGPGLGDRGCALDAKSFNGVPTLFIAFFFEAGRLQQVSINIPWWHHQRAHRYLRAFLGEPTAAQFLNFWDTRLYGWALRDGAGVFFNRDKALNPLVWNAIYWRSAPACRAIECFRQ